MSPEAIPRVQTDALGTERDNLSFDVLCIVAEILPRLSTGILAQRMVYSGDVGRGC